MKIPIPMAIFFLSKSRLGHPKNSTKLKFEKRSSRKHGPKFQFQVRNSWLTYLNIYYDRHISCLTKSCNFASGHPLDIFFKKYIFTFVRRITLSMNGF